MNTMASFRNVKHVGSCEGCLSSDRKLQHILDDKLKSVFHDIYFPKETNRKLWCWECRAIVEKVVKFKKQVIYAQKTLSEFMKQKTTHLPNLSRLSEHINEDASIINMTQYDKTFPEYVSEDAKYNNITNTPNITDNDSFKKEYDYEEMMPQFVKVENGLNDDTFADEIELVSENEHESKCVKKTECAEFEDSDDEPLKLKKNRREKKRSKKKDESKLKSKKERPAGVVHSTRMAKKLKQMDISEDSLEMILLSWEQVEEERQKMLLNESFTRHQYRCFDCAVGFNHRVKLDNHMVKHDQKSGSVSCDICTVRCKDQHALAAHKRRHRVRWRCRECGALWSRLQVAADHLNRTHNRPVLHTCATCGETLPTLGKLRNHMKNHSERQKCELCGKTFRDRTSLKTHLFIHNGEKEFACPKCDKRFLFKKAMEVHMVTHEKSELLYCYECDMNFKNKMSFYQHMKYNLKHIDPAKLKYACKLCDKKFLKAARLEEHNAAIHLKVTPIKCSMEGCNFACSSRPVLRSHIRLIHRNMRARRDHVCHTCGKTYTTKKCLEGHLRSHCGSRPFACDCGATFGYHSALYNHRTLVHSHNKKSSNRPTTVEANPTWRLVTDAQDIEQSS